jgi:hypothetical protein
MKPFSNIPATGHRPLHHAFRQRRHATMNRPFFKTVFPQFVAWTALVLLSAMIALAQDAAPPAGQRTDGQIEMDVVHALDAAPALKNDLITAATIESEVTLAGTVSSQASKDMAASIAGQVAGVTKVNNNLVVGNPQQAQAAQPAPTANSGAYPPAGEAGNQPYNGSMPPQGQAPSPDQGEPYQGQAYNPPPQYALPKGPMTVPQGTLLRLRTSEAVNSKRAREGEPVQFTVISDVAIDGVLAIPRGATVHGVVIESKRSGELRGSPVLALQLTSLDLGGQNYTLYSDQFKVKGPSKTGHTVGNMISGGLIGTLIGCAVGGGAGCAIGAGTGVAGGTAVSAASPGPGIWIPDEARVDFHLYAPLTVQPVSAQEAARLSQGLYSEGPTLNRREQNPYGSPYATGYYGSPYAAYPPVYYRPYYMMGGFYTWR